MRPVFNLKELNQFLHWEHFKMKNVQMIRDLIQEGDWMVKMDLKDAYFALLIREEDQRWLMFQWEKETYEFTCLPFGLSAAPRVFTKIIKPVVAWMRQFGCRMITYIDDNLLVAPSKEEAQVLARLMVVLFEALWFSVNYKKSVLDPQQSMEFLGFLIDSRSMTVRLPVEKLGRICNQARSLLAQTSITGRDLAQFIGRANSATLAIPPAPLFYQALQGVKHATLTHKRGLDSAISMTNHEREELLWWVEQAKLWNGSSLKPPSRFLKNQTDALKLGWGAVCHGVRTGGPWTYEESQFHINYLELLAAFLAIQSFMKSEKHLTVYVYMYNVSALTYINKKGGVQSRPLTTLAKECWWLCMERATVLSAEHLPGCLNIIADEESRHMRDHWDWKLHPGLFQRLVETFGPIEVDLFASRLTYQVPQFFSWKPDPQSEATDAFLQRWNQFRGYVNPPWGLIARVLSEVRYQRTNLILIAPV